MPTGPAARMLDPVLHPVPGVLTPGTCSINVIIGKKLAWRGLPAAAVAGLQAAKATSDATVQAAEAAEVAAMGTPGAPAATAAKFAAYAAATTAMSAAINGMTALPTPSGGMTDKHICAGFVPAPPPHGVGVVIDGSRSVFINGLPACRMGDTILEALGPMNKIIMGEPMVIIGDANAAPAIAPVPGVAAYATADEAARAALGLANPQSIAANLEFGGNIFQDPVTGKFGFTITPGTGTSLDLTRAPIPAGTNLVGTYHCHADYSLDSTPPGGAPIRTSDPARDDFNSNNFSGPDIRNANRRGVPSYLGTPNGGARRYDPATGTNSTF